MKKILVILGLLYFSINLVSAQRYENSYLTMDIPNGWKVDNIENPGVHIEMLLFMNDDVDIYNIGMIIGMEQYLEPQYALQNQMSIKSNIIFENAEFETIRTSTFMGKKACTADFSTMLDGKKFKGAVYAFNMNQCTILAIGCYAEGVKSKLPQIWKSITWKNYIPIKNYATLREEIQEYTQSMNKLLKKNPVKSEGEELLSVALEDDYDCLVYTYRLTEVSKSDFTDEQMLMTHDVVRPEIISLLKQQISQLELIQRCASENYVFKYIFMDKGMNFMFSIKVVPDDYNK